MEGNYKSVISMGMICRCETAVKTVLPVARASVARKLVDSFGFSQTEAARRMGISQPAISQYRKNIRGRAAGSFAGNPAFAQAVGELAKRIAEGSVPPKQIPEELCRLCRMTQ